MAQIYYCDACSFRIASGETPIEIDGRRYCGACHRKATPVRKPPTDAQAVQPASGSGVRRAAVPPSGSGVRRAAAVSDAATESGRKLPHKVIVRPHEGLAANNGRVVVFAALAVIGLCAALILLNSGGNNTAVARRDEKPAPKAVAPVPAPARIAPENAEPAPSKERLPGPGFLDAPTPSKEPLKPADGEAPKSRETVVPVAPLAPAPKVGAPAKVEPLVATEPPAKVDAPEVKEAKAPTPDLKVNAEASGSDPNNPMPPKKEPATSVPTVIDKDSRKSNAAADAIKALGNIVDRKRLWDGDVVAGGKGWVGPADTASLAPQAQVAHSGKTALLFHSKAAGWTGGGWNWHGWAPGSSVDATKYSTMALWMKVDWKGAKPDALTLKLVCSHFSKESTNINLLQCAPELLNGAWQQVVIPLSDFTADKTKQFDPAKLWQFEIHTFTQGEHDFNIYVDEVELELRKK